MLVLGASIGPEAPGTLHCGIAPEKMLSPRLRRERGLGPLLLLLLVAGHAVADSGKFEQKM